MDYFGGIREVCEVTLRSLRNIPACRSMTGKDIKKGEPVVYFDYLKVSNISGSVSTVYATGGRNNARRLSWDGDKEVTFHIEDALISATSMAVLTAAQMVRRRVVLRDWLADATTWLAEWDSETSTNTITIPASFGFDPKTFVDWAKIDLTNGTDTIRLNSNNMELIKQSNGDYQLVLTGINVDLTNTSNNIDFDNFTILEAVAGRPVYKHEKYTTTAKVNGSTVVLELKHVPHRDSNHPLFIFDVHDDGSMDLLGSIGGAVAGSIGFLTGAGQEKQITHPSLYADNNYLVDYYRQVKGNVTSLVITADGTSDYYKLEGSTLMRREVDGMDIPVAITIPKCRPRAQFEIPMSSTGDPATFAFDFDVFPAKDSNYEACKDNVMVIIDILEDDMDEDCYCVYTELSAWQNDPNKNPEHPDYVAP